MNIIRNSIYAISMLVVFWGFSDVSSQLSGQKEILMLNGEVVWPFEEAELRNDLIETTTSTSGKFSAMLSKPKSRELSTVRWYIGLDCLKSSNSDSRYAAFSNLNVFVDNDEVGELYLQTPRFNFQLGEVYKEFHYYSEATTVLGQCVDKFDDDYEIIYEFPNLEVKAGWNELYATISEVTENSETYTFSLDSKGQELVWELEPLDVDSYSGIGATIGYTESTGGGILITEIVSDGPADKAGLRVDDIIVAIDETSSLGMPVSMAVFYLRGPVQTKVFITVLRGAETLEFEIERGIIND